MAARIDGYSRIRAVLDISKKTDALTDIPSGAPARFVRGARLRIELLLTHGGEIADPSLIGAARLRVLSSDDPDSALGIDKTIGPANINAGITQADWDSGEPDKCHLRFELSASETAEGVFAGSLADKDTQHWFLLTYGAGEDFLFAGTVMSFDGATGTAGVPPPAGTAATLDQIRAYVDAALAGYVKFVGNPAGQRIELSAPTSGKNVKIGADDDGELYVGTQTTT